MLEPFVRALSLPLGVGLDEMNIVQEISTTGSAADGDLQVGDRLTHVDGQEVRDGKLDVAEAIDRSIEVHSLALQRTIIPEPGVSYLTVRLTPQNGSLGIGLTDSNVISELVRGSASDLDGRLEVTRTQ